MSRGRGALGGGEYTTVLPEGLGPSCPKAQTGAPILEGAEGEGREIKAALTAGRAMVFTWTASGPVELDMRGERPGGEARRYEKGCGRTSGHGTFVAPFTGRHGWLWRSLGAEPVKVTARCWPTASFSGCQLRRAASRHTD